MRRHAKLIVVGAAALGLAAVPLAKAQTGGAPVAHAAQVAAGDPLRAEIRNGTMATETEIIGKFNATTASKGGYVTRQSNTQTGAKAGGGAIYGCRGAAGGTAAGSAPCVRSVNLAAGFAFEFTTEGGVAGLIAVGDGKTANPAAKPFTTNATGVATGLNADQVDGKSATEIAALPGPPSGAASGDLAGSYPNPHWHLRRSASRSPACGSPWTAPAAHVQPPRRHPDGDTTSPATTRSRSPATQRTRAP